METRAHYVAVGAFVLAMVFLAFTAVLWLAGTQFAIAYNHYDIYYRGAVSGLSKGARVEYNGIPVGQVSDIELDPKDVERIRVTVEIKAGIPIKEDAKAEIQTNILSGVSTILITRGTEAAPLLTKKADEERPVIQARRSTFASLAAKGPELMEKLDTILDHVNDLLNDDNRKAFSAALDHVEKFTGTLADHRDDVGKLVSDADDAVKKFGALANDVNAPNGLRDQLSELVKGLGETNHHLDQVLLEARPGIRTLSQQTVGDLNGLINEARQFVSGLSRLAAQFEHDPTRLLFGDRRQGYQPK